MNMIEQSLTIHSNKLFKSYQEFYLDYPMGSYIPVWKIFRAFSKENHLIASHICSTDTWKDSKKNTIMDIGGGDGLVLKNIINLQNYSSRVKFVEPNEQLIFEAEKNLDSINQNLVEKLSLINKDLFSLNFRRDFKDVDVILLSHVLYLLESNSLTRLLNSIPTGIPIIIITDETNSLFTDCWSITADKYANRSNNIHSEIEKLSQLNQIKVKRSSFQTYLKNPYQIDREDLQDSLLSMITYSEYSKLSADNKIDIKAVFDSYSEQDLVQCNSVCYEIIKI